MLDKQMDPIKEKLDDMDKKVTPLEAKMDALNLAFNKQVDDTARLEETVQHNNQQVQVRLELLANADRNMYGNVVVLRNLVTQPRQQLDNIVQEVLEVISAPPDLRKPRRIHQFGRNNNLVSLEYDFPGAAREIIPLGKKLKGHKKFGDVYIENKNTPMQTWITGRITRLQIYLKSKDIKSFRTHSGLLIKGKEEREDTFISRSKFVHSEIDIGADNTINLDKVTSNEEGHMEWDPTHHHQQPNPRKRGPEGTISPNTVEPERRRQK
jgi:hypothetical protein